MNKNIFPVLAISPRNIVAPKTLFVQACSVFVLSACLLCWNLGARYLWQDEADTAVLAQRLFNYGKPLSYDGRNLVSRDFFYSEEEQNIPTGAPLKTVRYEIQRGDYRADMAWTGQPWGQFIVVGTSLFLFGHDTLQARLPLALAGALTAALLYVIISRRLTSTSIALSAVTIMVTNTFWVLHMRQSRYYALSCFFLLLTLEAYLRWQDGRRWGSLFFIGAAWTWFQVDYGTPVPVLAVFATHALVSYPRRLGRTILVFGGFSALIAPFFIYYQLGNRTKHVSGEGFDSILKILFELNQFQLPFLLVPLALYLWHIKRKTSPESPSVPLIILSISIVGAISIGMALLGPFPFYRYIVSATSLSSIVCAWVFFEAAQLFSPVKISSWLVPSVMAMGTLFLISTNLFSLPFASLFPEKYCLPYYTSSLWKPELGLLVKDLSGNGSDDPNRTAVEYLRQHLNPGDEILCSYEDKPLMFYLPNLIRGGMSCFRITDKGNVRFAVFRRSMGDCYQSTYEREIKRNQWIPHVISSPDIPWGNCPDPRFHYALLMQQATHSLVILERVPQ